MNRQDYLTKLLSFCTPNQVDMYNKIFPNGVDKQQLVQAISLVERTIKSNLEIDYQKELLKTKLENSILVAEIVDLQNTIKTISELNNQFQNHIQSLTTDLPSDTVVILERLDKLNRLEAAGVDNWDGYDYAME